MFVIPIALLGLLLFVLSIAQKSWKGALTSLLLSIPFVLFFSGYPPFKYLYLIYLPYLYIIIRLFMTAPKSQEIHFERSF